MSPKAHLDTMAAHAKRLRMARLENELQTPSQRWGLRLLGTDNSLPHSTAKVSTVPHSQGRVRFSPGPTPSRWSVPRAC